MRALLCCVLVLLGARAAADIVSQAIEDTELTVYRDPNRNAGEPLSLDDDTDGIAMVTETRTIVVPAGASTIQFRGVADGIVPQTAKLEGIPATIVEANFDFNLLSPGTLIEKSLDRPVRMIRTNRVTGAVEERRGILRSGPAGVVVDFGDSVEALNCSGLDERLVLDDLPPSLTDTPTLSLVIRAPTAGKYQVQLSYLTLGMDWSADYIARLHPDGRRMDVSGWITLVNRYGARFSNAKTHVVAGKLAREEAETLAPEMELPVRSDQCWPLGDFSLRREIREDRMFKRSVELARHDNMLEQIIVTGNLVARESQLGDYKLYTLPFTTTVEPRQVKQARLLQRSGVRFERSYEYRVPDDLSDDDDPETEHAVAVLKLRNAKQMGLGLPLPAGTFRFMETAADGRQYFIGEQPLEDTPVDLPIRFEFGESNDVTAATRLVEKSDQRAVIEVEIGNAGPRAVQVQVSHAREALENAQIVSESHRHHVEDGDYRWNVRVGSGKRVVLRYTVRQIEDAEGNDDAD